MRVGGVGIVMMLSGFLTASQPTPAQSNCVALAGGPSKGTDLAQPGATYCLQANTEIRGHLSFAEGGRIFGEAPFLFVISADNVTLDLRGHVASSTARLQSGVAAPNVVGTPSPIVKSLTLRNGSIELTRDGIGISAGGLGDLSKAAFPHSVRSDFYPAKFGSGMNSVELEQTRKLHQEMEEKKYQQLRADVLPGAAAYPRRDLRFESLRIRTHDVSMVLQGSHSAIRNSIIETDAGTAVWLYGPGSVIENNTIIVHGVEDDSSGQVHRRFADAPIRLHHADGAVIRNNRIIVLGPELKRAISVFETGAFQFEGNTIYGLPTGAEGAEALLGELQVSSNGNKYVSGAVGKLQGLFIKWQSTK